MSILKAPAIQENLRRSFWFGRFALGNRYEHQIRGRSNPNTAKPYLQTAHQIKPLDKHGSPIEFAVTIGIFKNQNPVLPFPFFRPDRIGVTFGNPKPPSMVDGEGYRLFNVRLASKKRRRKS